MSDVWRAMTKEELEASTTVTRSDWIEAGIRKDLRDRFALAALSGILARTGGSPKSIAEAAYECADAMLKERDRP